MVYTINTVPKREAISAGTQHDPGKEDPEKDDIVQTDQFLSGNHPRIKN
jgi:hypothetical protein